MENFVSFFSILLLLHLCSSNEYDGKPYQIFELKKFQCDFPENYVYPNNSCFVKPVNRTTYTLNMYVKFIKPIMKAFQLFTLEYRYSVMYREVFRSPKFEYCSIKNNSNPAIKSLFEVLRYASSSMFVECPIQIIEYKNAIIPLNYMPEIFPRGDYRMKVFHFDGSDNWTMNVTIISALRSSDHSRFG
ncbi:CLUMA_CG007120, isoform A [Clunio marinus]|uniref:CLUMA_CG007120, isoform A n=1 Tax=Clunio marinus TaxID=568069 RepID=A0A1J1I049_9DIPT|nr:CLUMA_CG007120, isoform A [Clunio marinus]